MSWGSGINAIPGRRISPVCTDGLHITPTPNNSAKLVLAKWEKNLQYRGSLDAPQAKVGNACRGFEDTVRETDLRPQQLQVEIERLKPSDDQRKERQFRIHSSHKDWSPANQAKRFQSKTVEVRPCSTSVAKRERTFSINARSDCDQDTLDKPSKIDTPEPTRKTKSSFD